MSSTVKPAMTETSPQDLRELGERFHLSVKKATLLTGGRVNENWAVESPHGTCVLRRYPEGRRSRQVRFEMSLLRHLHAEGQGVPRVLPTTSGEPIAIHRGRALVCLELLDATPLSQADAAEVPVSELIGFLLPIRSGLERFNPPFRPIPETHVFRRRVPALLAQLPESEQAPVQQLFQDLEQWEARTRLPTSVVHADIYPANILRSRTGQLYLIDFDDAHVGPRAIDWILPAIEFSWDVDGCFNESRYGEIVQSLSRFVSKLERSALPTLRTLVMLKSAATTAEHGIPLSENRYATAIGIRTSSVGHPDASLPGPARDQSSSAPSSDKVTEIGR